MDESLRARLRQALLDERAERIQTIEALRLDAPESESYGELSSYDQHPADAGSETFERAKDLGLLHQQRLLLARIEDALARLDDGTYGRCEICGQPIAEERLLALPYATACAACQAETERIQTADTRPPEEDLLGPPFARGFLDATGAVMFDAEDAWQQVASFGTSDGPQDNPDAIEYDETYPDADENVGIVQEVDAIIDERGDGVADPRIIYADPQDNPERRRHRPHREGGPHDE